jgi:tetratricopeptide (TPR) repeat protein
MLKYKTTALLALVAFALGALIGRGFDSMQEGTATRMTAIAVEAASLPAGHPGVGERSLGDVVAATLQMRGVSTLTASNVPAVAGSPSLIAQADDLRRQRKFKEAATVYRRAVASGGMTADAWADFADALASADSTLQGEPAKALAKALELEPRHAKALWLKASLEHEEHHYTDAVRTWRSLLAVVPANSSDARIIEANIAEASRLAASQG